VTGRTFIIAEIGTSHNGDLAKADELIASAASSGADCAKFQAVYADEIIHPATGEVPLPGGPTSLYDRFQKLERPIEFYAELKERTQRYGLQFLCTPFGVRSARMLRSLSIAALKIASPELNHVPLLREVAKYGLPVYLSAGVSLLADIEEAMAELGSTPVTLLHCVTSYPAPPEDYNLRLLPVLSALFGVPIGVSDHTLDPIIIPVLAVSRGASVIEKHITLSRSSDGLDDPVALEPADFHRMTRAVRAAETGMAADGPERVVADIEKTYGVAVVRAVLGTGKKSLAPSELASYGRTNRSIHALRTLAAGKCLESADVAVLRTEKILTPGIHPRYLQKILGKRLTRDVEAGEGIGWVDLLVECEDVDAKNPR